MAGIYGEDAPSYRIGKLNSTDPNVSYQGFAPEVIKLAGQLTRQRAKAGIGQPTAPDPGLIGRIFDVVQRPLYASANLVDYLNGGSNDPNAPSIDNPLEAAWRGFSGQDKTTYDKVLADSGMGGGWQRSLASFGMDVALDPSSYVGVGLAKDAAEGVVKKAATEAAITELGGEGAAKEAVKSATERIMAENTVQGAETAASKAARVKALVGTESIPQNITSAARNAALEKVAKQQLVPTVAPASTAADVTGAAKNLAGVYKNLPPKEFETVQNLTTKEAKNLAQEEVKGNWASKIKEAQDVAQANNKGKVVLKVLGKNTNIGSEKLYSLGKSASELANKSAVLRNISTTFRPQATLRQGTNDLLREAMGHSVFDNEQAIKQIDNFFGDKVTNYFGDAWGGLTQGQREMIPHAIENGTDLSQHLIPATGKTLEDYKQIAMKMGDNIGQAEADLGVRKAEDMIPNYVPHTYGTKGVDKGAVEDFAKGRKTAIEQAKQVRQEAEALNENIDKKVSRGVWSQDMADAAKVPTLTGAEGILKNHTLQAAKDAGLKPEEDISNILKNRAIKSHQQQVDARWFRAVDLEHGVHLDHEVKGIGKSKVAEMGKQLGMERVESPHFIDGHAWFHPEVAKVLRDSQRYFSAGADTEAARALGRYYDKVQAIWKLNMTALNPGHHIRNMAGDLFLNYEDGLTNPLRYHDASRVLLNWEKNPDAVKLVVGNRVLNAREIMNEFTQRGGKSGFFRTDLIKRGFTPVETIRGLAEKREDWTRMAHFIDVLKKEGKSKGVTTLDDLKAASREAGKRVRKWNIDYGDMTPFEKRTMKRVVPFYSWIRKNLPLQLETLAMQPGKVAMIPKSLRAIQGMAGQTQSDSLMGFNVMPQWLREMAGVRIAGEGVGRNATYWNPNIFPFYDVPQYLGGGPQNMLLNALGTTALPIRASIELGMGRSLMTGGPLPDTGMGYGQTSLLPPSVPRVWDIARGQADPTDWAKLFGVSLYNVGPQQQLGELRRQQDPVQALLAARARKPRSWEPGYGQPVKK
jgi:hypothetical protein